MKKEFKTKMIMLIATALVLHGNAQQPDSIKTTNLREVVITATKFPKSQTETGKVLTVIDEEQLSRSQGKDLAQVLNEQVGLVINGANSNPAKDKSVFLRGATGNYTLVLVDGVPLADPSGVGGAFDVRMLSLDHIERIEILKGSQSTLYGTDAIAGVINIITKQQGEKKIGGTGTLSMGSYNTRKANAAINGSTKHIDYNVAYSRLQTDGISEAEDQSGNGNFDNDGFDQNSIQVNFGIKPTEKISIKPYFRFADFSGKYDAGAFTDDPDAAYDSKMISTGLNSQIAFSNGSLNIMYAYTKTERTFSDSYGTYPYDGRFNHGEAFLNYDLASHVQLLGGLSYQRFKVMDENASIKNPDSEILSPYISFFLRNLNGFSAELGGRYVDHSVYGSNFTYSINPSYLINNRVKLFANYTTGFKAPTLSQLYGPFGANENLDPETSKSFESGLQFISATKKFDVRGTFFSRRIENAIAYTVGYVNLNTLDDQGFELEPSFRWNKISATAYYAFVEGEFTTQTQNGSETKENDLLRRPKHSIGLNLGYRASPRLFTSLNFKTFSKRNDLFFDFNTFSNEPVVLQAYQLLDVYASYEWAGGKFKLFVDIRNLLNQSYYEVYGYNTQRINFMTGISLRL